MQDDEVKPVRPVAPVDGMPAALGGFDVAAVDALIELARREDLGDGGDVTSAAAIDPAAVGAAALVVRQGGTLAGVPVAERVLAAYDKHLTAQWRCRDGAAVEAGERLGVVRGALSALLAAERVVLNFLSRLSGIATATRAYVDAVAGTSAAIVDTRKTAPGWRSLEKYAVRCGGGFNHRMGLYDMVLLKDNHRAHAGVADLGELLRRVRARVGPAMPIEVEVDNMDQFAAVLGAGANLIMLDNMSIERMRAAVALRDGRFADAAKRPLLEASGGITLESVAAVAATGVDRIAVGAITHSAPILDIGMDLLDAEGRVSA
jgi:nicotinate-nucleotide pyrophosphorylase (carboxylating)